MSDIREGAQIEVGASRSDGTIRYWVAKEAVTKGELILGSQISSLARLMTSASSVLGWSVTISIALIAAIASKVFDPAVSTTASKSTTLAMPQLGNLLWPAVAAEVLLLITAVCCVCVLWPGRWRPPGHDPGLVLKTTYETELEVLEAMAGGYAQAVAENSNGLDRIEKILRCAWVCFVSAPVAGLLMHLCRSM
jgi:hypothetical protein